MQTVQLNTFTIVYANEVGTDGTYYSTANICVSKANYPILKNIGTDLYEAFYISDITPISISVPIVGTQQNFDSVLTPIVTN
jgi:hypothetical protein